MRARWPAGDATSANYGRDATWRPFAAKQGTKSSWFTNKTFLLSTSIYDLVLIYVCHFHHHHHHPHLTFLSYHWLSRYSCLHLGSLHPRIFVNGILSNYFKTFIACQKSIPESFIKIVGPVFEIFGNKTGGHSFVIIRIHFQLISFSIQSKSVHVEYWFPEIFFNRK